MKVMNNLTVWKLICEIRYSPTALLVDNMGKIVTKWQGKYDLTDWEMNFPDNVAIHNVSRTTLFRTGIPKSAAMMELPENYDKFRGQTGEFLADILDTLHIGKITRIGLRIIQIVERKDFNTVVVNMRNALYNLQDDEWDILGGRPTDIGFAFTFDFGENKANFRMIPAPKQKMIPLFESNVAKEMLPSFALLTDFDMYKTNPEIRPKDRKKFLFDFLNLGENEILNRTERFVDHYGGFE